MNLYSRICAPINTQKPNMNDAAYHLRKREAENRREVWLFVECDCFVLFLVPHLTHQTLFKTVYMRTKQELKMTDLTGVTTHTHPRFSCMSHCWISELYNKIPTYLPSQSLWRFKMSAWRETLSQRWSVTTTKHFFSKLYSMKKKKNGNLDVKKRKKNTNIEDTVKEAPYLKLART